MTIEQLAEKLASLESRLYRLEKHIGFQEKPIAPQTDYTIRNDKTPKFKITPPSPSKTDNKSSAGNWLGVVSVICFVLAGGFIIKLSIESGWLTPTRQIAIAILFAFSLIAFGLFLKKTDREYSSFLPAAGVIILYLTAFAAYKFYALISLEAGLLSINLVSLLCIYLYIRIQHDLYPLIASVGSFIAPIVTNLNTDSTFTLYYFIPCAITFAGISIWLKSRILTLISAYFAIILTAIIGASLKEDILVVSLLGIHFLIFTAATYFFSVKNKTPLTKSEALAFLPVLLIFYATEFHFVNRLNPTIAPWISLVFAGVLIILYLSAKIHFQNNLGSKSLIVTFSTIVFFHSGYLELLPADFKPWLVPIIIFAYLFLPSLPSSKQENSLTFPLLAVLAIILIEYLNIIYHLLENKDSLLFVSFVTLACLPALYFKENKKTDKNFDLAPLILGMAHLLAVFALYRLTVDTSSLALSASWLFYAVLVIITGFKFRDEQLVKSALFVLAFAAGKALLYDASSAATIVRILCLLVTGVVLYGCGLLLRKVAEWKSN